MPKKKILIVGTILVLLAGTLTAGAVRRIEEVHLRAGDILVDGYGGFRPETLPRTKDAPITIYGGGKISTVSGELPPILHKLIFEFDRHGHVETTGLPVCNRGDLVATTVATARKNCEGAIVGEGHGKAIVKFPEQGPIPASSPITLFNGPKKHGNDTIFAHAYLAVPAPTTFIVPVEIEKIHNGIYGYRTEAEIPKIAGGSGHPISGDLTIGKKWTYKGKKHSYVNARCETGRLQARGEFTFRDPANFKKDKTTLKGTFFRPCKVKK